MRFSSALRRVQAGLVAALLLSCATVIEVGVAQAQTLTEVEDDVRTVLYFKLSDAALKSVLPPGFIAAPTAGGPLKDANFQVVLIDRKMSSDANGRPLEGGPNQLVVLHALAKNEQTGGPVTFELFGYSANKDAVPGVFGTFMPASVKLDRSEHTTGAGQSAVDETWTLVGDDGAHLELTIKYTSGVPAISNMDTRMYSAAQPSFYLLGKGSQGSDTLKGPTGDRIQQIDFKASGGKLTTLFDGSEPINVVVIPWGHVEHYLP